MDVAPVGGLFLKPRVWHFNFSSPDRMSISSIQFIGDL